MLQVCGKSQLNYLNYEGVNANVWRELDQSNVYFSFSVSNLEKK